MNKAKRKNLDPEELKALSLQAIEKSQNEYQNKVDAMVQKIERRLAQGKFTATGDGYLCIRLWGDHDTDFSRRVIVELEKHYSEVDYGWCHGGMGTEYRVKP